MSSMAMLSTFVRWGIGAMPLGGAMLLGGALVACSSDSSDSNADGDGSGVGTSGPVFGDGSGVGEGAGVPGYFAGQACAGQTAGAEAAPSVLQLLVDTSGSMDEDAPGARGSRWTVTRRAVLDAINGMPADTSLGVIFYPNRNNNDNDEDGTCFDRQTAVPIDALDDPGSQQRQRIQQAFQRQNPQGGTPTHDAYQYAVSDMSAATAIGPRFMVLITDGIPTFSLGCDDSNRQEQNDAVDPTPLIGEAAATLTRGVRTFVIGSPGSEDARESLSRMAEAGGTGTPQCSHTGPNFCHFDMTRSTDLEAGLESTLGIIAGVALGCRYNVPQAPLGELLDPGKVNVLFTPPGGAQELIGQSLEPGCSEGWSYSDDQTQIQLCGATCERVQASEGSLTLQFGCATELR